MPPTYPIAQPADNAPAYTYTQPIRDGIAAANDHQTRITALEAGGGGGGGGGAWASDKIMYVSPNGNNANNGLSWATAKQTLAAAITAMTGGGVIEVAGNHTISAALPVPVVGTLIRGQGPGTVLTYSASGPMLTLSNTQRIYFASMTLSLSNAAGVGFRVSNTFDCYWRDMLVTGLHNTGTGTTYRTQHGFEFVANAGDSRIINCDLNNLGHAVWSECIMNYMVAGSVNNCYRGVYITGSDFNPGFSVNNVTFQGSTVGAAQVDAHISSDFEANRIFITNCWFEGCTYAIRLGVGSTKGANQPVIENCHIAATNTCLSLNGGGRKAVLKSLSFGNDPGATPTEIHIDPSYTSGVAIACQSGVAFAFPAGTFPSGWGLLQAGN